MFERNTIVMTLLRVQGHKDPIDKNFLHKEDATFHHTLHDTKGNRENYPHFIDSCCNGMAIRRKNVQKDNRFVTTDLTARRYEDFFQKFVDLITTEDVEPLKLFKDLELIWQRHMK